MVTAPTISRLADSIRIAVAAHADTRPAPGPTYVTLRLHEPDETRPTDRRSGQRVVGLRRLHTGRNKALEHVGPWDVLIGIEQHDDESIRGAFTYGNAHRVTVMVTDAPTVDGAEPFEGVFQLKSAAVTSLQ